jgi:hypothetical protein
VTPGDDIHGTIILSYDSRYDTVVINSQIEDSSGTFEFIELNGRKIDYPYPRLSIFEKISTKVKFRVSIIQEHKEIASDISYLTLSK